MKTIQYGPWKIAVDVEKTKQYYQAYRRPNTQASKNFEQYCGQLSSEEISFFEAFGIDPVCCDIEHIGADKNGRFPCGGYYLVCGTYLEFPPEELISIEELANNGFVDDRTAPTVHIGLFEFDFQCESYMIQNIPENTPEGFLCIRFWCEDMKWLLPEKPEVMMYEPPRFWQVRKLLQEKAAERKQQLTDLEETKAEFTTLFQDLNIPATPLDQKEIKRYKRQWVSSFAPADTKEIRKVCLDARRYTPFLWHLFSFEFISCQTKETAEASFDQEKKTACILLSNVDDLAFRLENAHALTAKALEHLTDVTVTAEDFTWTYAKTHEEMCGPYFYKK